MACDYLIGAIANVLATGCDNITQPSNNGTGNFTGMKDFSIQLDEIANQTNATAIIGYSRSVPIFLTFFRLTVSVLIILFNGLVVTSLIRVKFLEEIKYIMITNLSLADLGVGLALFHGVIVSFIGAKHAIHCFIFNNLIVFVTLASIGSMMMISCDMYIMIIHPLKYYQLMTERRAKLMVGYWWVSIIVIQTLIIFVGSEPDPSKQPFPKCSIPAHFNFSTIMFLVSFCFSCLVIMLYIYGQIFAVARKQTLVTQSRITSGQELSAHEQQQAAVLKTQIKVAVTMFAVVGTYFIAWFPYLAIAIVTKYKPELYYPNLKIQYVFAFLGFMNSFVNPILYSFRLKPVRKAFRKTLCCPAVTVAPVDIIMLQNPA
ncbi:PREDICTED: octopamine receptor beta-2R-like [Priapulus caudatus]|uniref:Octopamine receptor beta-2R-like n=1 Tax=Priapulus caudatus TaxID=37621 RepID=A0ABM1DUN6_PRICU|nr:PREDICTED: octopamine receptor beta-2R-like [Priapulus caudatus]